jgi:tetratricopeptide (TPR) repeat protein
MSKDVRGYVLLASVLLLSACASSGPQTTSRAETTTGSTEVGDTAAPVIPDNVLTLFEQAVAVMAGGDFVDAELRFQEFLLQYPGYPGAHVNLAIIHTANGKDEAARSAVDAALAVNADYAPALNQLGMLLRKNGNFLEAEAAYLKAVTVSPDYALAHYNLGVLNELYLQRLDVALQHFESYQALVGEDKQVEKWIVDLTRRVAATRRTANAD